MPRTRYTFLLALLAVVLVPDLATAASITDVIHKDPNNINTQDIIDVLVSIIRLALGFAAAIGAIFIVVAGYQYVLAAGNPEKIEKAKMGLTWSIGGFILAVGAFAI